MSAPKLANLIGVFARPLQELEDVFRDIARLRDPKSPKTRGVHLDVLGELVGCPRDDDTDTRYAERIEVQALINASEGTVPELVTIVQRLAPGIPFELSRGVIAEMDLQLIDETTAKIGNQVNRAMQRAKYGGVQIFVVYTTTPIYFGWLEDPGPRVGFWLESGTPGGFGY